MLWSVRLSSTAYEMGVIPSMHQKELTPVAVFLQRMSGCPTLLKLAVATIFHARSVTVSTEAVSVRVTPFMYQTLFSPVVVFL